MLKDSKALKLTLLAVVVVIMIVRFVPAGGANPARQEVVATASATSELSIKTIGSDIQITVDPTATGVSARLDSRRRTDSKLVLDQRGSKITIEEKLDHKWFGFSSSSPTLLVTIPQAFTLSGLTVETVSGDIELETNLSAGSTIALKAISGEIDFLDLNATEGTVRIASVSGSIEGYSVSAKNIQVSSTSGAIEIYQYAGQNVELKSTSGEISGEAAIGSGILTAGTISGEIDLYLAPDTDARIQATSFSGSIQLGGESTPRAEKSANASLRSGTGLVEAKTTSADISIHW